MSQQHPSLPITVPLPVPVKKVSNIVFNDMLVSIMAGSLWGVLCLFCSFHYYKKENEIVTEIQTNYFLR